MCSLGWRQRWQLVGAMDWDACRSPHFSSGWIALETLRAGGQGMRLRRGGRGGSARRAGAGRAQQANPRRRAAGKSGRGQPPHPGRAQLAPRTTLSGQQTPPELAATSKAWHSGRSRRRASANHSEVLPRTAGSRRAGRSRQGRDLPGRTGSSPAARPVGEAGRPVSAAAQPRRQFSDADRARKRGFTWCGGQGPDGMSVGKLDRDPELRAMIEAWMAKFAAPGMCNPDDQTPTITGEPSQEVIDRDARSHAQRQHDALAALVRGQLGDPKLGQHNGLPVTVIVSATLDQTAHRRRGRSHRRRHPAADAGCDPDGLPRLALPGCVFDQHTERPLYLRPLQADRLGRSANRAAQQGPRLHRPGMRYARLPRRGPPRRRMGRRRADQHRQAHLRLPGTPPPDQTRWLENPKAQRRQHRMAAPTPPTDARRHQHLPSSRADAAAGRRRCGVSPAVQPVTDPPQRAAARAQP